MDAYTLKKKKDTKELHLFKGVTTPQGCNSTINSVCEKMEKSESEKNVFSSVYNNQITSLFNFSKISMYSIVLATLMLFIQISFLKKYFENQLEK